jgi:hypothetical protein
VKYLFQGYGREWDVFDAAERDEHSLFSVHYLIQKTRKTRLTCL